MDTDVTNALLAGARTRKAQTGNNSVLMHLSGAGNFVVGPYNGAANTETKLFSDTNPKDVGRIDKTYLPNGPVDEIILAAAAKGDVNAYFVCPVGIYGASEDHIARRSEDPAAKSFANAPGVWVRWMIDNVETLGYSPYVGEGSCVFGLVHVDDVVDLMLLVAEKASSGEEYAPEDVLRNFYLCVDERLSNKVIAGEFAEVLGKELKSVSFEEAGTVAK
jgi:nucleoside-diphosphate-sugar epimerase